MIVQHYLKNFLKRKEKFVHNKINIPEYFVSEFNKSFKEIVESNFNYVRIRGEISEIKSQWAPPSSVNNSE